MRLFLNDFMKNKIFQKTFSQNLFVKMYETSPSKNNFQIQGETVYMIYGKKYENPLDDEMIYGAIMIPKIPVPQLREVLERNKKLYDSYTDDDNISITTKNFTVSQILICLFSSDNLSDTLKFLKSIKFELTPDNLRFAIEASFLHCDIQFAYELSQRVPREKWSRLEYLVTCVYKYAYCMRYSDQQIDWPSGAPDYLMEQAKLFSPRVFTSTKQLRDAVESYGKVANKYLSEEEKNKMYLIDAQIQYGAFNFSYQGIDTSKLLKLKYKLIQKYRPRNSIPEFSPHKRVKNSRIKIGFISNYFRHHSVMRDRLGILSNLNPKIFEVFTIHHRGSEIGDDVGAHLEKYHVTRILTPGNIVEKIKLIRDLSLDILVFCDIGMDYLNYEVSLYRCAPIQINSWGHSDTCGCDEIDYYAVSRYFLKPRHQKRFSEKLYLLDSLSTFYYRPNLPIEKLNLYSAKERMLSSRKYLIENLSEFKIRDYANVNITACTQNPIKLNPSFDEIIRELLRNKTYVIFIEFRSEMEMKQVIERVVGNEEELRKYIIRLKFINDRSLYMYVIGACNYILDCYPFGGCNTIMDCFYVGVPVITRPAESLSGRFTQGFIKYMDNKEKIGKKIMIAKSNEEYLRKAIDLSDPVTNQLCTDFILHNNQKIYCDAKSVTTWENMCFDLLKISEEEMKQIYQEKK